MEEEEAKKNAMIEQGKVEVAEIDARRIAVIAAGKVKVAEETARMIGEAVAASLSAKLEAETSAIVRKYKEMGQAGVLSELFPHLPAIAGSISAPLAQTDRMTFITSDGSSATKVTNEVCTVLAQVPEAVESISGINLKGVMKNMVEREGGISGSSGTTV